MTSMGSNIDDLNDLMTQLARNGGQILLTEVSRPTVEKIVGVGCVWPEMSRQDIAQEVLLEIEAGSMGRPNAAQEVATAQRVYPLLIQLPGIDPEFLAKDLLRRMDDRLDLTQAFKIAAAVDRRDERHEPGATARHRSCGRRSAGSARQRQRRGTSSSAAGWTARCGAAARRRRRVTTASERRTRLADFAVIVDCAPEGRGL